jgi:hypothetical protein
MKQNERKGVRRERGRGRPVGSTRVKLNRVETEDFLNTSLQQILDNHLSYTEYVKWCKKTNGLSAEQANTYWLRVWTLLTDKYQLDRENLINKHLQKYWTLYDMSIEKEDISNARQVLESISRLLGMNEPEKISTETELKIRFRFGNDEE